MSPVPIVLQHARVYQLLTDVFLFMTVSCVFHDALAMTTAQVALVIHLMMIFLRPDNRFLSAFGSAWFMLSTGLIYIDLSGLTFVDAAGYNIYDLGTVQLLAILILVCLRHTVSYVNNNDNFNCIPGFSGALLAAVIKITMRYGQNNIVQIVRISDSSRYLFAPCALITANLLFIVLPTL